MARPFFNWKEFLEEWSAEIMQLLREYQQYTAVCRQIEYSKAFRKIGETMKAYSIDLPEKIVSAAEKGDLSSRKIAQRFTLSKNLVQKLVKQKRTQGHIVPRKQGGMVSPVMKYQEQLIAIGEKQADATLAESCELFAAETGLWVSQSTMCRTFPRLELPRKKTLPSSQAASERVQILT